VPFRINGYYLKLTIGHSAALDIGKEGSWRWNSPRTSSDGQSF